MGFSGVNEPATKMTVSTAESLRVSDIKDPWVLFERYNTEEIRRIERKVRGEIEQKKEELRQMVGERYRDLIDAADTIGEMRQCSQSVVLSIQDMNQYCQKLKQGKPNRETIAKQEVRFSVVAVAFMPFMYKLLCRWKHAPLHWVVESVAQNWVYYYNRHYIYILGNVPLSRFVLNCACHKNSCYPHCNSFSFLLLPQNESFRPS